MPIDDESPRDDDDVGSFNAQLFVDRGSVRVRHVELSADDDVHRHREKLARIVLDEMYQFVALLDTDGKLLEVNRAALEGAGIRLGDIQGKSFWDVRWWTISRDTQEQLKRAIQRAASGEFVRYDVEVYGAAHGQETIIIDFSLIPVKDSTGRVVFLLPEGRNITEKKQAEQEIARKNEELERVLRRVRELDELKSQFFANVSHELRTPLALIVGPAEQMLADGHGLTELQRRDLEVIRRNAATLLKHVNDLLDVSKLDAGKMETRYADVDLARVVRVIAGHFEALAPQREIAYEVDVPPVFRAQVDPEKLERVLLNLLSNAFKFVPAGGRVRVSLAGTAEGRALLSVQDSGPGVRPELRATIFERFRQGDAGATRQFGGTGLGLAIAKDFVELHGGTLSVTDAPGGGALFQAELPVAAPEGALVVKASAAPAGADPVVKGTLEELRAPVAPARATRAEDAGRPRVLVVEDNAEMNRFIAECLEGEFAVEVAFDGTAALAKLATCPPDLIITDIMMPGMSGDQLTHEVRKRRDLDNIPILVLSAKADDALRIKLLREGAQDYVVKPFSAVELHARAMNLVKVKRARELLQAALVTHQQDLELLAEEVTTKGRELQTALEAMRAARDEAERANEVKSNFLSMVSHELRTPLTTIQLQLERLDRDRSAALTDRQRQMVHKASGGTQRLLELVEALLEHTRIDSGRLTVHPERFDPAALLGEAVEELRPRAERKGLALALAADGLEPFATDPRLLRLVVLNLVDNAIKFTAAGRVEVAAETEAGILRLAVRDTGQGVAPEQQARIFEAFEQLEPARQKHLRGVGLGLAIVKRILDALGGRIDLRSAAGRGSEFVVSVPELAVPPATVLH